MEQSSRFRIAVYGYAGCPQRPLTPYAADYEKRVFILYGTNKRQLVYQIVHKIQRFFLGNFNTNRSDLERKLSRPALCSAAVMRCFFALP